MSKAKIEFLYQKFREWGGLLRLKEEKDLERLRGFLYNNLCFRYDGLPYADDKNSLDEIMKELSKVLNFIS